MAPLRNQPGRPPLTPLTGLRFFPALHVVCYHFAQDLVPKDTPIYNLIHAGYIGVNLFFILSGFILTYVYVAPSGQRSLSCGEFWLARFSRVYPVYGLSLLASIPGFVDTIRYSHLTATASLAIATSVPTAMQSWLPNTACAWNCPGWSISTEAFFYLLFPALGIFLIPQLQRISLAGRILAIGFFWLISMCAPMLYTVADRKHMINQTNAFLYDVVQYNPLVRLPEFCVGIVLGTMFLSILSSHSPRAILSSLLPPLVLLTIIAVLVGTPGVPAIFFHNGLLVPLFTLLILTLALHRGPVQTLLSLKPVVLLGEASYSMYIMQDLVWSWLSRAQAAAGLNLDIQHSVAYFLTYVTTLIGVSILTLKLVEVPARRYLRGAWHKET